MLARSFSAVALLRLSANGTKGVGPIEEYFRVVLRLWWLRVNKSVSDREESAVRSSKLVRPTEGSLWLM